MSSLPRRLGRLVLIWSLAIALCTAAVGIGFWLSLPTVDQLLTCDSRAGSPEPNLGATKLQSGQTKCAVVEVPDLPPYLIQALLATEDRHFYDHIGIDPRAIARAILADLRAERFVQGGSTITQQLAKSLLSPSEWRIASKVREMMLALRIERRCTKYQILTLYLNRVYFGSGAYGIEAAAQRYFGKSAQSITLYEAAMLVGLLPAPSRFNPLKDAELADSRARLVLQNMVDGGVLSQQQARRAIGSKRQQ